MTRPEDRHTTTPEAAAAHERHHGHDADPPDPISPLDVCFHMSDEPSAWFDEAMARVAGIAARERGAA